MGSGLLNLGPHGDAASTVLTEPPTLQRQFPVPS